MLTLVIGNKRYSSWSLRPWLAMTEAGIPFEEVRIALYEPGATEAVRRYSAAGRVPVLVDSDAGAGRASLTIWDSLAIVEYLADIHPDRTLWPADRSARAHARSMCAEMHSGFAALRTAWPMNIGAELPGRGWSLVIQADVDRIVALWRDALTLHGGPFLFCRFSIADAFFAPMVTRFRTYATDIPSDIAGYCERVLALPSMQSWERAAQAETEIIDRSEPYRLLPQPSSA